MNITPEQFLKTELEELNLTMKNIRFVKLAESVADFLQSVNPGKIIDYGCGTGVYAEIIRRRGLNITAVDIWKPHRIYCRKNFPELDVRDTPFKADTMLWIEVAEHMTDDEIINVLDIICPRQILFSSTSQITPNDADWGHINIKPQSEWIEFFNKSGYRLHAEPNTPTTWSKFFVKA
jgi:2-polyprenyl-3-methyl-5-hydroxy-6-metoxy-1,4-benzoquinol methylase